ncbi:hypothetical protein EIP86_004863 [Pleurotus ostreatoroseus]|nr:hypothetical protein EIP86_004863 [Pleurotus ostreatoroseus]
MACSALLTQRMRRGPHQTQATCRKKTEEGSIGTSQDPPRGTHRGAFSRSGQGGSSSEGGSISAPSGLDNREAAKRRRSLREPMGSLRRELVRTQRMHTPKTVRAHGVRDRPRVDGGQQGLRPAPMAGSVQGPGRVGGEVCTQGKGLGRACMANRCEPISLCHSSDRRSSPVFQPAATIDRPACAPACSGSNPDQTIVTNSAQHAGLTVAEGIPPLPLMNSRVFGAQPKMSQYPDILDALLVLQSFTPAAHPLNSSIHGQLSQRQESRQQTISPAPGLWGNAAASPLNNGSALSLEKDFCSNFTCCGLNLADMHQLLDHFEERHVVVVGRDGNPVTQPLASASGPAPPTFTSAPSNTLAGSSPASWTSVAVGYPQPFPAADASFGCPPSLIDTNFLLPASCSPLSAPATQSFGDLDLDFDLDFLSQQQQQQQQAFDPFRLDFDLESLGTRPSSPSASSTFSTPSLTWSDSSSSSFGQLPFPSQPNSGLSSPGYSSPLANGDVEAICLPPSLLSLQPQSAASSLAPSLAPSVAPSVAPSARQTPEPITAQPQQKTQQQRKDGHSDVEESREKEKRTTVGKIKAKIFGSGRSERKPKSDGYSKKRDPRREKAYKCPKPGCIKSYLNPNGLKYHLEKGTCIIDPLYRPPVAQDAQAAASTAPASATAAPAKRASSQPIIQRMKDNSIPEPRTSLPTPLLPVKPEPSSPPLSTMDMRTEQQTHGPFYYAYTYPFQYGTTAQVPNQ